MASVSDIRTKPKFFVLKKNHHPEKLCKICKLHTNILVVKWGCDYIITTDLLAKHKGELKSKIHAWCESDKGKKDGKPPECFGEYQDAGYV